MSNFQTKKIDESLDTLLQGNKINVFQNNCSL